MTNFLPDLLEVSLTTGAVIALLLLLTPVLAKRFSPRWRYFAWLFVALRLCLPFNLNLPAAPVQVEAPAAITARKYDPEMEAEIRAALPHGYQASSVGGVTYEVWFSDNYDNEYHIYENPIFRLDSFNGTWGLSIHWEGLWAFGAGISLLYLAWDYGRMCRDLKKRRLAPSEAELRELEKQRRLLMVLPNVELYRVPGLGSPMLIGFLRPAVLLPENLPEGALAVTLAHELTHLKRHDLWYKLLLALARCLHWFNPMVWLMCGRAGRDVELCCDYDLLRSRDEDARRVYGQAILDQMTAGAARNSRLTTGFSGDKQEVFARFRAIMDTSVKKKGRAALALTLAAVLLGGGLVACRTEGPTSSEAEGHALGLGYVDKKMESVSYQAVDWFDEEDHETAQAWWDDYLTNGAGETTTADLAEGAEVLYRAEDGQTYPLNPATIMYTNEMTLAGSWLELTFNGEGLVTRLVMRGGVSLDLDAPDLDFTGYTGLVYAAGMGGISHASNTSFMNVDPCGLTGNDRDYARYNLPLAEGAEIPDDLKPFITGLSSGQYPELYQLQLVGGEVARVTGLWEGENMQTSVGYAVIDLEHYTGELSCQDAAELSYSPGDDFLMMGDTKLPLARGTEIADKLKFYLSGEQLPDVFIFDVLNGAVTDIYAVGPDELILHPSEKFSRSELLAAADVVRAEFAQRFENCTLDNLRYNEAFSDTAVSSYMSNGRGSVNGVSPENVAVLVGDFEVPEEGGPPALNPGMIYQDYMWILIRDSAGGAWRLDDMGY